MNGRVKRSMSSNSPGRVTAGYPAAAVGAARTAIAAGPDAATGSVRVKVLPFPATEETVTAVSYTHLTLPTN